MFRLSDSPLIQELFAERARHYVRAALEARFTRVPPEIGETLDTIQDERQLRKLHQTAVTCLDLDGFRAALVDGSKQP